MENNWYEIMNPTENISQGDILFNCPLFVPIYPSDDLDAADFDKIEERELTTNIYRANVIILNQACDLEVRDGQDSPKLKTVLVGTLQDVRKNEVGKNKLAPIAKLEKPQLFLLEPSNGPIKMGHQIVHFDALASLPWKLLNTFGKTQGQRLRVKSPYIEQLSQHFGSHFGRVALPENREEELGKYFAIKNEYEEKRKKGNYTKMWKDLSEDEVLTMIEELKQSV